MLYNYYLELKNRIFLLIITWLITVIICYLYKEILLFLLIKANSELYNLKSFYFISTGLTDVFKVYLRLSYFLSTQFLILIFFYHFIIFIAPALFYYEYKIIKIFIFNFCLFFCISIFSINYFIIPNIWNFFFSFQNNNLLNINIFFEAKISDYLNFYINVYYTTVAVNYIFFIVLILLNFVQNKIIFVLKTRKIFYFVFLIIATLVTPPDVISQVFLVLYFILIFELLIWLNIVKISILTNHNK